MNIERVGLGLSGVLVVGLVAWNIQLNGQIAELQAATPQADGVELAAERSSEPMQHRKATRMRRHQDGGPPLMGKHGGDGADTLVVEGSDPSQPGHRAGRERRRPDFAAMRTEMESQTIEMVEAFGTQSEWEPETTEQVLGILLETGEAVGQLWSEQHSEGSETTHYQARKEMHAIRADADAEIEALIGSEAADELGEQLFTARRETMRRMH
ncbi:MAG: hypothetical protein KC912_21350 [Proteobacteria bacterium]|nr:hypothetical protein [Pseudomonadota bacterium]